MLYSLLTEFGKCCCAEVHAPRAQRQIIISFAADTVLHSASADRGVHTGAARYLVCSVAFSLFERLLCSDVMFQICVCDIMRYFTVFIVGCF